MPDTASIPKLREREYPEPETRRKLTPAEKQEVRKRQDGKCAGCGIIPKAWEFDHIDARWKGQVSQAGLDNWQGFGSRNDCKCHRIKTGAEAKDRAKMNRLRGKAGQLARRKANGSRIKGRSEIASRGLSKHPHLKRTMSGKVVPR